jgi:AraC-like DNA-binding protein
MAVDKPSDWAGISAQIGFPIRFEAVETRLVFPEALHDRPLPGADPINHTRLLALCAKLTSEIPQDSTAASQVVSFLEADRKLGLSLSEAAASLGYSERSLRRQLARSDTSYRKLADQVAAGRARELLADTARPIQAIAFELGFDTPSNFARSFKRWTGKSPKAFRISQRVSSGSGQD